MCVELVGARTDRTAALTTDKRLAEISGQQESQLFVHRIQVITDVVTEFS